MGRLPLRLLLLVLLLLSPPARAGESVLARLEGEIREIARKAGPAVVRVTARRRLRLAPPVPDARLRIGELLTASSTVGTGFLVSKEGHVVTASPITEGATSAEVEFAGGRILKGEVLGSDSFFQVSLLRVEPVEGVAPLTFSVEPEVPAPSLGVFLGNPVGRERNVALGIVTSTRQSSCLPGGYDNYFVVNTPIHPGDIGGPLVDAEGRVRGMGVGHAGRFFKVFEGEDGTSVRVRSLTGVPGMGLGVPAADLRFAVSELRAHGRVRHGRLGVLVKPETLEVTHVRPSSPAARAGLEEGDVFVSVDRRKVGADAELRFVLRRIPVGKTVTLEVRRAERVVTAETALEEMASGGPGVLRGVRLSASGALTVLEVDERLAAAGLAPGDVIVSAFGRSVESSADLARVVSSVETPVPVRLGVRRGGRTLAVSIPR